MKPAKKLPSSPGPKATGKVLPITGTLLVSPRLQPYLEIPSQLAPPDEETLRRLNAMASQYPFCIRHKGRNSALL